MCDLSESGDLRDRAKINAAFSAERDVLDAAIDDEGTVFSIPKETGAADRASQPAESVAFIFPLSLRSGVIKI